MPGLPVAPTLDDPLVAASSPAVGGPLGRHAARGVRPGGAPPGWWTALRVVLALSCLTMALGLVAKQPCRADAWPPRTERTVWLHLCYSDLPYLYRERGLAAGAVPYLDDAGAPPLEYPVLTGALFGAAAWVARATLPATGDTAAEADRGAVRFYDVMALLLLGAALVTVVAVARTVSLRPYDAALVAASPVLALSATINADLVPAALVALAVLAWTRERPLLAGVLLGLGTATKLYPLLVLGPVVVLCARQRRWADAGRAVAGAAVAWAAVDLPVWLLARESWLAFWRANDERPADFGSPWYAVQLLGHAVPADRLNLLVTVLLVAACAVVAALGLLAPAPPRLAQLAFLLVAAFCLLNKVWSPQYALWLLPLAALARPRWRDLLIWQAGEVVHFVAVWLYLDGLYSPGTVMVDGRGYALVTAVRAGCLLWLMAVVVRDVLRPERDPVPAGREMPEPAPASESTAVA